MRSWSDGQLTALTTAERLEVSRQAGTPGTLLALDAGVYFVKQSAQVRAPVVSGNFISGQLEASGGVTLTGRDRLTATSPTVTFDRSIGSAGQAASDAGLWFSRPGLEMTADQFTLDVGDEHATFDNLKSTFTQPK